MFKIGFSKYFADGFSNYYLTLKIKKKFKKSYWKYSQIYVSYYEFAKN
jgi:hypothetical protein